MLCDNRFSHGSHFYFIGHCPGKRRPPIKKFRGPEEERPATPLGVSEWTEEVDSWA